MADEEKLAVGKIIALAEALSDKSGGLRDAHPKAHGCVHATFTVFAGRAPETQHGVFKEQRTYKAWIRFSNGQTPPEKDKPFQKDNVPDVRGMAIKLLGVEGQKVLDNEPDGKTQDFLLISNPTFFARNAQDFVTVVGATMAGPAAIAQIQTSHKVQLEVLNAMQEDKIGNPLAGQYWSTVPFQLGPEKVKYFVAPTGSLPNLQVNKDSDNFLQGAMQAHLSGQPAHFDFFVQFFKNDAATPIEDPTLAWDVNVSPMVKVASIEIPQQQFTSPDQKKFCEELSFTPWHALVEHRPIGAINEARRPVYGAVSQKRHQMRGVPRLEPTD